MFDVQPVDRMEFKRHQRVDMIEADMADEPQDPDAAADRLEAALERIARLAAAKAEEHDAAKAALFEASNRAVPESALSIPEIAERLDSLIGRLRAALGTSAPGTSATGQPE